MVRQTRVMDAAQLQFGAGEAVIFIAVTQIALWTIIPALCFNNAPLDVIENIAWGQEWQLGYYKHPPLQAWLTGLVFQTTGQVWLIYLLSQLSVVVCFWCIWELGRDVADERGQLLAVMFFSLLYYANLPTPEFNANVLQMPIWAAAMLALWRAINSQKLGWWLVLGVVMALSVYAKYSFAVLVAALAAALLSVPQGLAALKRPGLYIAIALTCVLIAPQMMWLVNNDFLPFSWAEGRAEHVEGLSRITSVLKFLLAQLADHIGSLVLLAVGAVGVVTRRQGEQSAGPRSAADRYVLVAAFAPIAVTVLVAIASGSKLRDMWAAPMFVYTGLAAAIWLRPHIERLRWTSMFRLWAVLFIGAPVGVGLAAVLGASPARVVYDGQELGRRASVLWHEKTGRPLQIVAGPTWQAGVITAYAPSHPSSFVDGDTRKSPWITADRLGEEGALAVWPGTSETPPDDLMKLGPFLETGAFSLPYYRGKRVAHIGWAIVAPRSATQEAVRR